MWRNAFRTFDWEQIKYWHTARQAMRAYDLKAGIILTENENDTIEMDEFQ
jgi:hypothetical protein